METIEGIGAKRRQALLPRFGGLRDLDPLSAKYFLDGFNPSKDIGSIIFGKGTKRQIAAAYLEFHQIQKLQWENHWVYVNLELKATVSSKRKTFFHEPLPSSPVVTKAPKIEEISANAQEAFRM